MKWIHLAQGTDQWRSLVNMIIYLRVQQNESNFLTSCEWSARELNPTDLAEGTSSFS